MTKARVPFALARNSVKSDELLTMQQIAGKLGCTYQYVRALACGAEQTTVPFPKPFTKLGRRPLWKQKDIDAWRERLSAS